MVKTLAILGSTGSIGCSTLDVVRQHPDLFRIAYLTANSNAKLLCSQVREFKPRAVAVTDQSAYDMLKSECDGSTELLFGIDGLVEIARRNDYSMLVSSLVGFAGVIPTVAAIQTEHDIALANKETLVVAGEMITRMCRSKNVRLVPIDSEHSAILQCLTGEPEHAVRSIILTASGGPFRGKTAKELLHVSAAQALKHPNWKMGNKITIDSATMMNKGLEVIEAKWLFNVSARQIDVVVHPQSIVHSMVVFTDGSVKAQMGLPDMKGPIRYALTYPDRIDADVPTMDFSLNALTFEAPDRATFRCLDLAYQALETGGTAPAVLNAANEIAVQAFLEGEIGFMDIPAIIEDALGTCEVADIDTLETIIETDRAVRSYARARCCG